MEYKDCLIPQPTVPADATEADFPEFLDRKCCPGMSCGNTHLQRAFGHDWDTGHRVYGYKRDNDDWHFGPYGTLEELVARVNNADLWPIDKAKRKKYWAEQEAAAEAHNAGLKYP